MECPNCQSDSFIKNGKTYYVKQRFKCKSCGRQFIKNSNQPVSNPLAAKRDVQIPPVAMTGNGFIYLVGCGGQSALPKRRLGCSVRLSSNSNPDSGGLFTKQNGFPIRIDSRRPCTLG